MVAGELGVGTLASQLQELALHRNAAAAAKAQSSSDPPPSKEPPSWPFDSLDDGSPTTPTPRGDHGIPWCQFRPSSVHHPIRYNQQQQQ